jgi:hypothetical protein
MESFYISLPCNFKNNHKAYYKTELPETLNLSGIWQVGISDISFPKSWFNVKKEQNIQLMYFNPKNKGGIGLSVVKEATIPPSNYTKKILVDEINKAILKHFQTIYLKETDLTANLYPMIQFDYNVDKFILYPGKTQEDGLIFILPSLELCYVTGYDQEVLKKEAETLFEKYIQHRRDNLVTDRVTKTKLPSDYPIPQALTPHRIEPIKFVYVLSDKCGDRIFGSTTRPILRCVEVPFLAQYGDQIFHTYNTPQYQKLHKSTFSSIEIKIRTNVNYTKSQEPIEDYLEFQDGDVLINLHFRKIGDLKRSEERRSSSSDRKSVIRDQDQVSDLENTNDNINTNVNLQSNIENTGTEDNDLPIIIKPDDNFGNENKKTIEIINYDDYSDYSEDQGKLDCNLIEVTENKANCKG